MMKRVLSGIALLVLSVAPVLAKGWDPVTPTVRLGLTNHENSMSGLSPVYTDQSLEPQVELATSRRLSKSMKLGLTAIGTHRFVRRVPAAGYTIVGLGSSLRSSSRQVTLEGEWTPKRNVSPLAPGDEGGQYKSYTGTLGYRQVVKKLRLRFESTYGLNDYVPALDVRDAHALEGYASASLSPETGVDLRTEVSTEFENANAAKYDKRTAMVGLGLGLTPGAYKLDLRCRSVKKRYPNAIVGDSNYRRRDQRIELQLKLTRPLRPGLAVYLQGDLLNQTSSRPSDVVDLNSDGFNDHTREYNFSTNTILLGFEWIGGGK